MMGTCSVPGVISNQFAMDEYLDNFRVATTVGNVWEDNPVTAVNSVFVYDDKMQPLGSVTGLAPRERIYSVRYDGDRGYIVTFRQVCICAYVHVGARMIMKYIYIYIYTVDQGVYTYTSTDSFTCTCTYTYTYTYTYHTLCRLIPCL